MFAFGCSDSFLASSGSFSLISFSASFSFPSAARSAQWCWIQTEQRLPDSFHIPFFCLILLPWVPQSSFFFFSSSFSCSLSHDCGFLLGRDFQFFFNLVFSAFRPSIWTIMLLFFWFRFSFRQFWDVLTEVLKVLVVFLCGSFESLHIFLVFWLFKLLFHLLDLRFIFLRNVHLMDHHDLVLLLLLVRFFSSCKFFYFFLSSAEIAKSSSSFLR